jgi:transcriptional regulator with XRE-family HTH domain
MSDDAALVFRQRLRELRRNLHLSQEELAERATLNYKHYQEIERGGKKEVRLSTLVKIARALEIPLYHLFTDEPASVVAESASTYRAEPKKPAPKKRAAAKTKPKPAAE